ncbi:hypothetical protein Cgig2_011779 [Carnegiea gigantea]|uniref:Uncharacterized protein n=1 Tax=Carnegiea gigantea TaxID=171969 RepID=A0A9Q1JQQ9_9CARY|nr:hypothetical protein Cgig2_011779 [Carnegiea gigantea]
MRNQRHGGDRFKRNLVVYVVSTLIKGQQSLKVNHIVPKSSVNVKEVNDFNGCEFMLGSLVSCTDKWKRQSKDSHRDPILFLMRVILSTDEQKRDVIDLGFQFLLALRIDKIPSILARWLVENFDTCKQLVKLAGNDEGGDLFKRNSVVYVVSTLNKGQQSLNINHIVLKSLVNVKELRDLNWWEFTLDSLASCTDK